MNNEYYIAPDNIPELELACTLFDNACQECVDNNNNPEYNTNYDFGFNFDRLEKFAKANPNFDYQKLLPNHYKIISYFFSQSIIDAEERERKSYQMRMKHYTNW